MRNAVSPIKVLLLVVLFSVVCANPAIATCKAVNEISAAGSEEGKQKLALVFRYYVLGLFNGRIMNEKILIISDLDQIAINQDYARMMDLLSNYCKDFPQETMDHAMDVLYYHFLHGNHPHHRPIPRY